MNNVDSQYLNLLRDILDNGTLKQTRAGEVKSVFGRMMRFNLQEGFPLLTTKKMYTKGIIHELLWFLKGSTNIKYLVDNNVHIWDDDAYRFYMEMVKEHNICAKVMDDYDELEIKPVSKTVFLQHVVEKNKIDFYYHAKNGRINSKEYYYGDLGPVYGKQWRRFGFTNVDQIKNIIRTLKTNPDDRRMLCIAFNPDMIEEMALPPCHYAFQFYTRELTNEERLKWLSANSKIDYEELKNASNESLDELNVPKRELSLMFQMRSNDFFLGNPYNISSYSFLLSMIAQVVNMSVGELVYCGGDVHLYTEHISAAEEQLTRDPHKYDLPTLELNKEIKDIDDFTFEDIKILDYNSYPPIKAKLLVG